VDRAPQETGRTARQSPVPAPSPRQAHLGSADLRRAIGSDAAAASDSESAALTLTTPGFTTAQVPEPYEARTADRQDHAVPPGPPLQGYIDEANSSRIKGWVWNPQQPESRITLELVDGDTRLATALANQYRPDLRQVGIGDGRHAFTIPVAEGLLSSARNVLHLRCAETGSQVPGSPVIIERREIAAPAGHSFHEIASPYLPNPAAGAFFADRVNAPAKATPVADAPSVDPLGDSNGVAPAMPRRRGAIGALPNIQPGLQSNIDFADWTGVKGWIWDPQEPEKRITLEFLDGDTALATVVASEYRPDLEEAGIGDGRHGFSIAFGETLLPYARHVLHLRSAGSAVEVPTFPIVLTREQVGLDPSVMQFILSNVKAETARARKPEDLSPLIADLVQILDQTVSYSLALAGNDSTLDSIDLLGPTELEPQVKTLIGSIQKYYPIISISSERHPLISIVIPVYNKFNLTYNCVKSIVANGAEIPFEIIIVDDCSRDETIFAEFAFGRGIRLVRNATNSGFIRTCNRGFESARGEYVVFLNNDTEVKARWLDELYETMQRDPKIGVVGSKLLYPDGTLQECGGIVWRLGDGWNWGRGQPAGDPRFCYMRDADYVSGAALMIKASLFAELGKFDEHYLPAYYEDTDLCFRARQLGYRVAIQPASEVIHFEGASAGTSLTGTGMKRFQAINHRKFFERWKETLASHRFNGELPELESERNVRQRALFIDDSVPEPDKDAGSNAAFQHMLSLQRLGYKVTFIPGDNMARIDPYTTELQRRGIECLYHPYYFSVEDVFRKRPIPFELVYLHRYSNASKYAGMIRQHFPRARILYNVADLHFLRMQRQAEVQNDPSLREKADQMRRVELGAMSFVDCVIVHSAAEATLLRQLAPDIDVQVIPWTVALRDINKKTVNKTTVTNPEIAFIGGYRHPPNVDAAKWAAQSIMPALRGKVPGVELLLVGSHMPTDVSALATKDIVPLGYVPSLDSVFDRVRLTIAPLRFGAGLKGKVLESMAAGIPCVMTTVAAEGIDLPSELQLLVADGADALAERIATLCRDAAAYQRVVEAGKAHVTANYSPERIDSLIRQACAAE
jgi:GT2 family glycosyltransferase/glycosyltransferase involved in cell wall biosynthesis